MYLQLVVVLYIFFSVQAMDPSFNSNFSMSIIKDYGEEKLDKIFWLHFPRTGSGFGATVLRYACENIDENEPLNILKKPTPWVNDISCNMRYSAELDKSFFGSTPLSKSAHGNAVVMFRRPTERFASQLRWMRAMASYVVNYGVSKDDVRDLLETLDKLPLKSDMNISHPCYNIDKKKELRVCRYVYF